MLHPLKAIVNGFPPVQSASVNRLPRGACSDDVDCHKWFLLSLFRGAQVSYTASLKRNHDIVCLAPGVPRAVAQPRFPGSPLSAPLNTVSNFRMAAKGFVEALGRWFKC